jgi:hypothetical protein
VPLAQAVFWKNRASPLSGHVKIRMPAPDEICALAGRGELPNNVAWPRFVADRPCAVRPIREITGAPHDSAVGSGEVMNFEYKCVGAPERPKRLRGASRSERVALAMQEIIDAEAVDGWEYLRTDLVPVEERAGLFSRTQEVHRAVLIFRREPSVARAARPALAAAQPRSIAASPQPEAGQRAGPAEQREERMALSAERGAPPPPRTNRPPKGLG